MTDIDLTVTLELWWLVAWVAIGLVAFLPANYLGSRKIVPRPRFWPTMWRLIRRRPIAVVVNVIAWPIVAWEAL